MRYQLLTQLTLVCLLSLSPWVTRSAHAVPEGYRKSTITLNASPVGLAYHGGTLYVLESPQGNVATLRTIHADGSFGSDLTVTGTDDDFFVGGMEFDPFEQRLLISDNATVGRIYAVDLAGNQTTVASGIEAIADLAVRSTGEIFASSAASGSGRVDQVDRMSGATTTVVTNLGYGAGIAFDAAGDLLVQDSDTTTLVGRVQSVAITEVPGGLTFAPPTLVADGLTASYGIVPDSEGDLFLTGFGGLYALAGEPPMETLFDSSGAAQQFSTAVAFSAGSAPFEPLTGLAGGRLAYTTNSSGEDAELLTIIRPQAAANADFNGDDLVDLQDLNTWSSSYGNPAEVPSMGDADDNGTVAANDLLIWQRQFNPGQIGGVVVPEPGSILLFTASFCTLLGVRARRPKL